MPAPSQPAPTSAPIQPPSVRRPPPANRPPGQRPVSIAAAAQPVLVDSKRLHDLFIPDAAWESTSCLHMQKLCQRRYGKSDYEPLLHAWMAIQRRWERTVETVIKRGGLLRLGGTQYDAIAKKGQFS